jgi:[ribosomal protein S5]-alanine N-acetyltransferase
MEAAIQKPDLSCMLLKTSRLVVRNLTDSDHTAYFRIFGNPNIALYDDYAPITQEDAIRNIEEIMTNYGNGHAEQEFAVALSSSNITIGILYMKEEDNRMLVGYHFNEEFHGKGYAVEAVEAFITWMLSITFKSINALVDHNNKPSIRLLEKLGFELVHADGDELVYALPV